MYHLKEHFAKFITPHYASLTGHCTNQHSKQLFGRVKQPSKLANPIPAYLTTVDVGQTAEWVGCCLSPSLADKRKLSNSSLFLHRELTEPTQLSCYSYPPTSIDIKSLCHSVDCRCWKHSIQLECKQMFTPWAVMCNRDIFMLLYHL